MNPVSFFVRSCFRSNVLRGATAADKMKHAATLWQQLTPVQKEKVAKEAAKVTAKPKPHYRIHRVRRFLLTRRPDMTPKQVNAEWKAMSAKEKQRINRLANRAHKRAQVLIGARKPKVPKRLVEKTRRKHKGAVTKPKKAAKKNK